MVVPRMARSSPIRGDGGAAAKPLDERADAGDARDEVAVTLDDLAALVEQACTPSPADGARSANQTAKELLEQRKTIHEQERLMTSLRSDLAVRGESLVKREDTIRGLEGELADLRSRLREAEAHAASERAIAIAIAAAGAEELEKKLALEREALAASVAAHARALVSAEEQVVQALAERDRAHVLDCRARARAHRKVLAERCAKAEEIGQARAAAAHAVVATTMQARLRDAEQSLASARAKHAREVTELRLQAEGLREAAAAEQRLAQHAMDLHARARAELADVCRALEAAEREAAKLEVARDEAVAELDRQRARSRDTLDDSGVRLTCGQDDEDGEGEADDAVRPADGRSRRASGP